MPSGSQEKKGILSLYVECLAGVALHHSNCGWTSEWVQRAAVSKGYWLKSGHHHHPSWHCCPLIIISHHSAPAAVAPLTLITLVEAATKRRHPYHLLLFQNLDTPQLGLRGPRQKWSLWTHMGLTHAECWRWGCMGDIFFGTRNKWLQER